MKIVSILIINVPNDARKLLLANFTLSTVGCKKKICEEGRYFHDHCQRTFINFSARKVGFI
jgi:hypothetical protein